VTVGFEETIKKPRTQTGHTTVRATTLLNSLLNLDGIAVQGVSLPAEPGGPMVVDAALRRQRLACPLCHYTTRAGYDKRPEPSWWRHLDFGTTPVIVRAMLRRLDCPTHGVLVEAVPFARHRARFTRDFEDLTAFLATRTDKTTIARFLRIDWDTIGRICERVVATDLDTDRLDGLVNIGVDEISWKKHHKYLTLVTDHTRKKVVWGKAGKDTATLDAFFDDLGPDRSAAIEAVSMDMGPAFNKSVRADGHASQAVICIDPFHAVQLVGKALDVERRKAWNELRNGADPAGAKKFKGARWALLKNPANLTDDQAATLRKLKRRGGDVWRAYTLKEAFRAIFAGDLDPDTVTELLDRWISRASRSRLPAFVKAAKTIRKHRDGIAAAIRLGINNARNEGINNVVRLIIRRARGFHCAEAALALVLLACGPITLQLPHERPNIHPG
jgi:transposase